MLERLLASSDLRYKGLVQDRIGGFYYMDYVKLAFIIIDLPIMLKIYVPKMFIICHAFYLGRTSL